MMDLNGLFFVGTDTDVGKTFVTSQVARILSQSGHRVGVYKPACSGAAVLEDGQSAWHDVDMLASAIDAEDIKDRVCGQCFQAALAPPVAARLEGSAVEWQPMLDGLSWWRDNADITLVEGVGGVLCPLTEDQSIADFAEKIQLPLVIIAHLGLGTINHTLLTIEAARRRRLPICGVILNQTSPHDGDLSCSTNQSEIERRGNAQVLGILEYAPSGSSAALRNEEALAKIDWLGMTRAAF